MQADRDIERTYNACYRHGVDEKRRVQVPAKWRPARPGAEFTLILWPKPEQGPCIRALPPKEMAGLVDYIRSLANDNPKKTVLKRLIGSSSAQATVDKAGRICLPDEMAKEAGIGDEAMLVGLLDRFEIWSPARYQKVKAADQVMAPEALKLME